MGGTQPREVSAAALQQKAEEVRALLGDFRASKKLVENVETEDMVLKRTVEALRMERDMLKEEVRRPHTGTRHDPLPVRLPPSPRP